jgi:hypothetical protein
VLRTLLTGRRVPFNNHQTLRAEVCRILRLTLALGRTVQHSRTLEIAQISLGVVILQIVQGSHKNDGLEHDN